METIGMRDEESMATPIFRHIPWRIGRFAATRLSAGDSGMERLVFEAEANQVNRYEMLTGPIPCLEAMERIVNMVV